MIDPVANVQIGTPLKTWVRWPVDNPGPDRDDSKCFPISHMLGFLILEENEISDQPIVDFTVTIPEGLESKCSVGGACAIQWYWYAEKNLQTYESCVDFVIG